MTINQEHFTTYKSLSPVLRTQTTGGLTKDVPRFDAKKCRDKLLVNEGFDPTRLLPFAMRPFDLQWCYYSPVRPLWREPRPDYWASIHPERQP